MGLPYTYERVLQDSQGYPLFTKDGLAVAWWETYLRDSGFPNEYRPLSQIHQIVSGGRTVGIVTLAPKIAESKVGHVVAVDECGFINPSMCWPERIGSLSELLAECCRLGCEYVPEKDFLAITIC